MAKTGFEYTVIAKLTDPNAESLSAVAYTDGMYMGPNAAFNVAVNANDVKDYGDDNVTETDTSVVDATVSVEHNELTQAQEAYILGHTIDETSHEMISNGDDVPPYLGIGLLARARDPARICTSESFIRSASSGSRAMITPRSRILQPSVIRRLRATFSA